MSPSIWKITTRAALKACVVIDVSIEGVSQALAYRDEFSSIITKNGGHISALTEELRHKTGG